MLFSSLGDWLGLLATTALAAQLSGGSYATANFAIAGVFIARLLPAVFLGPIAGVIADRFDRRRLMVSVDLLRGALYISIPIVQYIFLALRCDDLGRMFNSLLVTCERSISSLILSLAKNSRAQIKSRYLPPTAQHLLPQFSSHFSHFSQVQSQQSAH
jgi:MFS family permease